MPCFPCDSTNAAAGCIDKAPGNKGRDVFNYPAKNAVSEGVGEKIAVF